MPKLPKYHVDSSGREWHFVNNGKGRHEWVRSNDDHDEVCLEMKEVREAHRKAAADFWPSIALGFILNLVILTFLCAVAILLLPSITSSVVAIVMCCAYSLAYMSALFWKVFNRVVRMEYHAITVHEVLLKVKDKICRCEE